jgi:hypothetical protein
MRIVPLSCLAPMCCLKSLFIDLRCVCPLPLPGPALGKPLALHTNQPAVESFTPRLPFTEKDEKERAKLIHVTVWNKQPAPATSVFCVRNMLPLYQDFSDHVSCNTNFYYLHLFHPHCCIDEPENKNKNKFLSQYVNGILITVLWIICLVQRHREIRSTFCLSWFFFFFGFSEN